MTHQENLFSPTVTSLPIYDVGAALTLVLEGEFLEF